MIGLRTEQGSTGALEITTRFQTFAILVAAGVRRRVPARRSFSAAAPIPLGRAVPPSRRALGRRRQPLRRAGAVGLRAARAGAVLQQPLPARSRHPGADLCDARLGAEHRGRPRRPARSRLRRVLRGRRLFLRAAGDALPPVVLALPAARRHLRRVLGRAARLSGAAAARRLSRHRHARVRRDHPARAAQLAEPHRRAERHRLRSRGRASSACRSPTPRAASPRPSASTIRRPTAWCSCST